ncbi:MAG TPA: hypothetical protein VGB97_01880 [Candidatus Paceibacterota bacterium]|jgi:hypothetical protein
MNREEALQKVIGLKPKVVYLCGKTCTGKTTFTNLLVNEGYARIELDQVVMDAVVTPFNVVPAYEAFITAYQDVGPPEHVTAFVEAAKSEIIEKLAHSAVIVEGSIGKSHLVKQVFEGMDFLFMYFHPTDVRAYEDRIRRRFVSGVRTNTTGLPKEFWNLVEEADLATYLASNIVGAGIEKSISKYVTISIRRSQERLDRFMADFPSIWVVEV